MARRRGKKTHHRRRRRIGAMKFSSRNPLVKWGSVVLGFFAGNPVNTALDGIMPASLKTNTNYSKIASGGELGLGALLMFSKFGKKSVLATVAGGVLLGAGIKRGMAAFNIGSIGSYGEVPVLNGYGKVPVIGRRVSGYTPNQSLNGYTPNQSLNGSGSRAPHLSVMGSVDRASGSGLMEG